MKRKRHTEEQIIAILKEHEAGMKTADLCISEVSFYNWKAKLKKLLADAMLDNAALKDLLAKKW